MNDLRIADLIRQAVELDEMERDVDAEARAETPTLRLTHGAGREDEQARARQRRRRIIGGIGAGLAAAACVGVAMTAAVLVMLPGSMGGTGGTKRVAVNTPEVFKASPEQNRDARVATVAEHAGVAAKGFAPSGDEQCCVVIALVRDSGGVLRCVRWRQHDWDVQRVSEMTALDLKVAVPSPCMATPQQVVLVALTGPTRSLPRTDESAERLASCILGSPRGCETDGMCFTGAAARCLPSDVSVKVETVAYSR